MGRAHLQPVLTLNLSCLSLRVPALLQDSGGAGDTLRLPGKEPIQLLLTLPQHPAATGHHSPWFQKCSAAPQHHPAAQAISEEPFCDRNHCCHLLQNTRFAKCGSPALPRHWGHSLSCSGQDRLVWWWRAVKKVPKFIYRFLINAKVLVF